VLRVTIQDQIVGRRFRQWRMDPTVMHYENIERKIRDKWPKYRSAASQVRQVIAHAENTGTPLCITTLDIQKALGRIYHNCVRSCKNMEYGSVSSLRAMYSDATASVQTNDTLAGPIWNQCCVRRGCPLSIALHALCQHTLLCTLDHSLQSPRFGRRKRCRPVLEYAHDVTVFVTHPAEFANKQYNALKMQTGAPLNPSKSKSMALGGWTVPAIQL
jgi:hypothetical protein